MSDTRVKKTSPTDDPIEESSVIAFLQENPQVLLSYPDIFASLSVPHQTGGVTSLVERQLKVLRDQNQTLKNNMGELVTIARENEDLNQRFHRLALELMSTDHLHDVLAMVQHHVQTFFYTDYVCFRFLPTITYNNSALPAPYLSEGNGIIETAKPWIEQRKPVCGELDNKIINALFGPEVNVSSCALIPLYNTFDLGLLCLGSTSKERFNENMGSIFLQQLGELVSIRLQGLLAD